MCPIRWNELSNWSSSCNKHNVARAWWICVGAAAAYCDAAAQEAAPVVYERSYFDAFAPQTALDMARRVPGFTIAEGEERRGFAGAAGNVLIDGAPPVAKAEDLEDILERIPAADVVRIELVRGAGASASTAQAVRINIVRRPTDGSGVWQASLRRADDGRLSPAGEASWSGRWRTVEYRVSAALEDAHVPIRGVEEVTAFPGGLDERAIERITEDEREGALSGEVTLPAGGGALTLSGSLASERTREREFVSVFDSGGAADGAGSIDARELEEVGELGANYVRIAGGWETELSALVIRRRLADDEYAEERDAGGAFDESERERRRVEAGETIVRGAASRTLSGVEIALAAEIAHNTLDQRLALFEDEGAGPLPVDVPAANVSIEEWRGEASAIAAWRAGAGWRLEAGAAAEATRLTQSGDSSLVTELSYWKPTLQAVRAIGEDDQLRLRIYRDVGQLDFEDFAASAELAGGDVFAGNANLRPQTSWRAEASADWRFEDGALELTLYYWRIEDALDFVPVGPPDARFDARGNIDDGALAGVRTALEIPAPLIEHARLRVEGLWQKTEVTDPLTGESRAQSEAQESLLAVEFRHDLRALGLAWGIDFAREGIAPEFRFDRVTEEQDADELTVWAETTRFAGLKARVFAANLLDAGERRVRSRFDPDRTGVLFERERRDREPGMVIGVELQGAF